jgi:hypothetical protein
MGGWQITKKASVCFLVNKKAAKKLYEFDATAAGVTPARRGVKVFWFFFSKKNCFLTSGFRYDNMVRHQRLATLLPGRQPPDRHSAAEF